MQGGTALNAAFTKLHQDLSNLDLRRVLANNLGLSMSSVDRMATRTALTVSPLPLSTAAISVVIPVVLSLVVSISHIWV